MNITSLQTPISFIAYSSFSRNLTLFLKFVIIFLSDKKLAMIQKMGKPHSENPKEE